MRLRKQSMLLFALIIWFFILILTLTPFSSNNNNNNQKQQKSIIRPSSLSLPNSLSQSTTSTTTTTTRTSTTTTSTSTSTTTPEMECEMKNVIDFMTCIGEFAPSLKQRHQLIYLFYLVDKLLNNYNFTYFATGGTLLGVKRNNNHFIPYDDDVDLFLHENQRKRFIKQLKQIIVENRTEFAQLRFINTPSIVKIFIKENSSSHFDCFHPIKQEFCWPFIDAHFYIDLVDDTTPPTTTKTTNNNNNTTKTTTTESNKEKYFHHIVTKINFSKSDIFPLERSTIDGNGVWLPRNWQMFIPPNSLTQCCTNRYNHKLEKHNSCWQCLPCYCLQNWIHFSKKIL